MRFVGFPETPSLILLLVKVRRESRKKKDKINCICFCNQLSMGYVTKTEDMTTSVRFNGVPAQGKMNPLFIFHRIFFLLKFTGVPAQGKMISFIYISSNFFLAKIYRGSCTG